MSSSMAQLTNVLMFQGVWWGVVLFHGVYSWLIAIVYLTVHMAFISQSRRVEAVFILIIASIGVVADFLWFSQGLMLDNGLSQFPHWLIPLWLAFATTLPHSLFSLEKVPFIAGLFGAVFGPLSYWAGTHFTQVSMPNHELCVTVLAAFWVLFLPLSLRFWRMLQIRYLPAD